MRRACSRASSLQQNGSQPFPNRNSPASSNDPQACDLGPLFHYLRQICSHATHLKASLYAKSGTWGDLEAFNFFPFSKGCWACLPAACALQSPPVKERFPGLPFILTCVANVFTGLLCFTRLFGFSNRLDQVLESVLQRKSCAST